MLLVQGFQDYLIQALFQEDRSQELRLRLFLTPSSGQSSNPSIINNENNSNAGTNSGVGSNVGNNPGIPDVDLNFNDELDLNSLPPPPPPPNILPPSPPPNLVPSREE